MTMFRQGPPFLTVIPAKAGIHVLYGAGEEKKLSAALLHQLQTMLLTVEQVIGQDVECLDERLCL